MKSPIDFNKRSFMTFINAEYGLSRQQAGHLYDSIAGEVKKSLLSGGLIKLFGLGAMKITHQKDRMHMRVRFRSAPGIDAAVHELPVPAKGDSAVDDS